MTALQNSLMLLQSRRHQCSKTLPLIVSSRHILCRTAIVASMASMALDSALWLVSVSYVHPSSSLLSDRAGGSETQLGVEVVTATVATPVSNSYTVASCAGCLSLQQISYLHYYPLAAMFALYVTMFSP